MFVHDPYDKSKVKMINCSDDENCLTNVQRSKKEVLRWHLCEKKMRVYTVSKTASRKEERDRRTSVTGTFN